MLLLTGATGLVGMEVLARWLDKTDRRVCVLLRADDDEGASQRVRSLMEILYDDPDAHPDRVVAVAADLERPDLGLERDRLLELAAEVDQVIHSAASVSFTLGLEESRAINVKGTRRMLEFAEDSRREGGLERFTYVSTAYVAGAHRGVFREDHLDTGQSFRNAYEQTKFEAESLVQAKRGRFPIQVVRPSIVMGDSRNGWTPTFNVLYRPLKAFVRGAYPIVPAKRSSPVDVVPVDYVADAIFELSHGGGDGTYNLVAGRDAVTAGRLMELASDYFDVRQPRTAPTWLYRRLIHPLLLRRTSGRKRQALERSEAFFPYFKMEVHFDDERARSRLEPAGIRVKPLESYNDRLIEFALESNWGRRPARRGTRRLPVPA
jgi:thioester reductase-like protein